MSWNLLRGLLGINSDNTGGEDVTAKEAIVKFIETYGVSRTRDIIDGLEDMGWSENTVSQELANLNGGPIYSPRRGVYAINNDYEPDPEPSKETAEDLVLQYIADNGTMDKYAIRDVANATGHSADYIRQVAARLAREGNLERDHYTVPGRQSGRKTSYYKARSSDSGDTDDESDGETNYNDAPWDLT